MYLPELDFFMEVKKMSRGNKMSVCIMFGQCVILKERQLLWKPIVY